MIMRDRVLEYMSRNRIEYVDMLEIMRRGSDRVIYAGDDGILMQDTSGGAYLMSAESPDVAGRMLDMLPKPGVMEVHQKFIIPLIEERYGMRVDMRCYQSAWFKPEPPAKAVSPYPIVQLGIEYLDDIDRMYIHGSREYIAGRIDRGELYGCVDEGRLVAFIGTHSEGAMGMLEVADDYRRHGLGAALFTFMTARQMQLGRYPFSHIESHNEASLAMHRKYGFEISSGLVFWLV